jgi:DNA-binding protein H-NS
MDDNPKCERMENFYLQILRLWVYLFSLCTAFEKDMTMAEPQSVTEWLEIELDKLSWEDKLSLISEVCDALTAQQLKQVREMADEKRLEKLEDAKAQVILEMREKFEQLDLDFEEVMGIRKKRGKSILPPKYRSPDGKEWSGRGMPPQWIRDYEEEGGDREDYLIKEEG